MKLSSLDLSVGEFYQQFHKCNCISCLGKKIGIPEEVTDEVLDLYYSFLRIRSASRSDSRKLFFDDIYVASWDSLNE